MLMTFWNVVQKIFHSDPTGHKSLHVKIKKSDFKTTNFALFYEEQDYFLFVIKVTSLKNK
jgi:hypothetical protein